MDEGEYRPRRAVRARGRRDSPLVGERYGVLRMVAMVYQVVGIVIFAFGVAIPVIALIAQLIALAQSGGPTSPVALIPAAINLAVILLGVVFGLGFYALAEGIHLFLSIEENIRRIADTPR